MRCKAARCVRAALTAFIAAAALSSPAARAEPPTFENGVISRHDARGFVYSAYPVIARLETGRLLCVFSVRTAADGVEYSIAFSTSDDNGRTWSQPEILFDHTNHTDADPNLIVDGDRVLAFSTTVPLPFRIDHTLIYMRESRDGRTWGREVLIETPHRYIAGKIHQGHRLADGTLIMGYAWDTWAEQGMPPATEGEMNIRSGVLRSTDGTTWVPGGDIYADVPRTSPYSVSGLDEPATVVLEDGRIMGLLRAPGRTLYQTWSTDGGLTWEEPRPSALTAHNSPAALWRLDGSGDVVAVWSNSPDSRNPLAVALSSDGGVTWSAPRTVSDTGGPQASYPSVVQAADGTIIIVWQQDVDNGREVRIARFNRAWLLAN